MANHLERLALFANPCFRALISLFTSVCHMWVRIRSFKQGDERCGMGKDPLIATAFLTARKVLRQIMVINTSSASYTQTMRWQCLLRSRFYSLFCYRYGCFVKEHCLLH